MSSVGKCGHCGHEPVAIRATICPKCNGSNPVLANASIADWGKTLSAIALVIIVIVGGTIYLMS